MMADKDKARAAAAVAQADEDKAADVMAPADKAKAAMRLEQEARRAADMLERAEAAQARLAEIEARLDAKMAALAALGDRADAGKMAPAAVENMRREQRAREAARLEQRVRVNLFYDGKDYADDVFVSVNGDSVAIKRGEEVEIKLKHWYALQNSDRQDLKTAELIRGLDGKEVKLGDF